MANIKMQCGEYEKSEENFIQSLTLLYASGIISKVEVIFSDEKYRVSYLGYRSSLTPFIE